MLSNFPTLIKEKGLSWFFHRGFYSVKLKVLRMLPFAEFFFEKRTKPLVRLDLFDFNRERIKEYLCSLDEDIKTKIIISADEASVGKILGFSKLVLNYGCPINWHLNPLTGKETNKNVKWYKIPDFDKEIGDIKIIWEASRFSHLFLFSRAFLLTGDKKYYRFFSEQIKNWVSSNKYSYGANYKCGQECSIRMINILFAASVFAELLDEKDKKNIEIIVVSSYKKVLSNFNYAYKCQNNNHALSEICGMLAGAYCTNDFKRIKLATEFLNKSIKSQFFNDGGYIQQSFVYQRLAFQDLEVSLTILNKLGITIKEGSKELINKSILLMYQCMDDSGDMPNFGSNDGSLIFPFTTGEYRDFRSTANSLYAIINKKRIFDNKTSCEELLWLNLDINYPLETLQKTSSSFHTAGLYTFRKENYWLMFVAKMKSNHMDNGHIDVWAHGKNILCDSGTYSYSDKIGEKLISTEAHNTIVCENIEQLYRFGKFTFYGQPKVSIIDLSDNAITCEFNYQNRYIHKRALELTDSKIVITDSCDKEFVSVYHTPLNVKANIDKAETTDFLLVSKNGIKTALGKKSLYYLSLEDINIISIDSNCKVTTTIINITGGL